MNREQQLESYLFTVIRVKNGVGELHPDTVNNALAQCLGSPNVAVRARAAKLILAGSVPSRDGSG